VIDKVKQFMRRKEFQCAVLVVLAVVATIALLNGMGLNSLYGYGIVLPVLVLVGVLVTVFYGYKNYEKRTAVFSLIFAIILALSFVIGQKMSLATEGASVSLGIRDAYLFLAWTFVVFFGVMSLVKLIQKIAHDKFSVMSSFKPTKRFWLTISGVIFICWLPYLLAFFPGYLSLDSFNQLGQATGGFALSNAHPILTTGFLALFVNIGLAIGLNMTLAVSIAVVAQMLVFAMILGFIVYWLAKNSLPKIFVILAAGYFALHPIIAIYSITVWKDVLFSGFLVVLVIFLYDLVVSHGTLLKSKKWMIGFLLTALLVVFWRNNGIYIVLVVLLAVGLAYRAYWKVTLPAFTSVVVGIFIIQGPIYNYFNLNEASLRESVAIPLQQIAYTAKTGGEFSDQQRDFFASCVAPLEEMAEGYISYSPDPVKSLVIADNREELNDHCFNRSGGEFLEHWLAIGLNNPQPYIQAYLMQTIGFWYVGSLDWYSDLFPTYIEEGLRNRFNVYPTDLVNRVTGVNMQQRIWDTTVKLRNYIVVNKSFLIWLMLFAALFMIVVRKSRFLLALLPLIALWLTLLVANPSTASYRYSFAFCLALPVVLGMMFALSKNAKTAPKSKSRGTQSRKKSQKKLKYKSHGKMIE
jgi:hypothetical protein